MKKLNKTLFSVLFVTIIFLVTGCMSKEDKALKKEYEQKATKVMEKYLEENYPTAKLLEVKQEVRGNGIEGYSVS